MKKLFIVGAMAFSLATFASNSVNAQSKNQKPVSTISVTGAADSDLDFGFDTGFSTDPQARRGTDYWVQLFNVYLDVYLQYGYSAHDAINRAKASVYREIEIYYGVDL